MTKKWIKDGEFYQEGSSVVIDGQRYFAPLTDEQMIAAGYKEYIPPTPPEPLTPPEPTPEELLEHARQEKLMEIDSYDQSPAVNSFTINGQEMWLTVEERQQIATQISANEAVGRETMTRYFGGQEFTFPISTWKQMLVAVEVYAGDALNVTEAHKATVEAMTNIEDVEAFDITDGYPEKLVFGETDN
jgi:hypothetical protein